MLATTMLATTMLATTLLATKIVATGCGAGEGHGSGLQVEGGRWGCVYYQCSVK
jgi:hypothetical protein